MSTTDTPDPSTAETPPAGIDAYTPPDGWADIDEGSLTATWIASRGGQCDYGFAAITILRGVHHWSTTSAKRETAFAALAEARAFVAALTSIDAAKAVAP